MTEKKTTRMSLSGFPEVLDEPKPLLGHRESSSLAPLDYQYFGLPKNQSTKTNETFYAEPQWSAYPPFIPLKPRAQQPPPMYFQFPEQNSSHPYPMFYPPPYSGPMESFPFGQYPVSGYPSSYYQSFNSFRPPQVPSRMPAYPQGVPHVNPAFSFGGGNPSEAPFNKTTHYPSWPPASNLPQGNTLQTPEPLGNSEALSSPKTQPVELPSITSSGNPQIPPETQIPQNSDSSSSEDNEDEEEAIPSPSPSSSSSSNEPQLNVPAGPRPRRAVVSRTKNGFEILRSQITKNDMAFIRNFARIIGYPMKTTQRNTKHGYFTCFCKHPDCSASILVRKFQLMTSHSVEHNH